MCGGMVSLACEMKDGRKMEATYAYGGFIKNLSVFPLGIARCNESQSYLTGTEQFFEGGYLPAGGLTVKRMTFGCRAMDKTK
jgi:hypothetical protein